MDRQEVGSESSHEEEITEEWKDTELVESAAMDTTLGCVMPSSQEAGQLEDPLILGHLAWGDGEAEPASAKCGLDTPMMGGDATSAALEEQREGQSEPPTPVPSPTNSPKQEDEPSVEVTESDQGDEVICYAIEVELKSLD